MTYIPFVAIVVLIGVWYGSYVRRVKAAGDVTHLGGALRRALVASSERAALALRA
ncbi:MAG: hypothetical protein H6725_16635 [Sandaracinaceae bacterium]|nr:hypothetical protein [Sandaracinaceae bacterium]